jgi:glycosyltransferase involved in cell wall biosynthesis
VQLGGSNTYFNTLIRYLGPQNVILILEHPHQLVYLNGITTERFYKVKVLPSLTGYVELHHNTTTNIRNVLLMGRSLLKILYLCLRYGSSTVTISAIESEKYIYMLLLPFTRVNYILHTEPAPAMNRSTVTICNYSLNNAKTISTVSGSMKNAICSSWSIDKQRQKHVIVVYNCAEKTGPAVGRHKTKNALIKQITTLGNVSSRKNPAGWFEVARAVTEQVPDAEFLWLGDGDLLDNFQEISKDLPRINFAGPASDVHTALQNTDIYYQPSLVEPQGIAVLEAMAHELPCVVSDVGGLPESVQNGYNGIVVNAGNIN